MKSKRTSTATRYAIALTWVYFTLLFSWLLLYLMNGDRFGYLGILNSLAVYIFTPIPLIAFITIWTRRRVELTGTILGAATFIWFWGPLFIPPLTPQSPTSNTQPTLTVMTYNVLGLHKHTDPVIEVIHQVDADVVFIQELNTILADSIRKTLSSEYPYQILDPVDGVSGMGTISRYPLALIIGEQLPMNWVGTPQVMALNFEGDTITLVHFHSFALTYYPLENVNQNFRYREAQAQVLAAFAENTPTPLIVAGDANATQMSDMYRTIIRSPLRDAWWEAGFGLGHTFPGSALPGSARLWIGGWYIPQWLARIDYIFFSPHWDVIDTTLAPFDSVSDHRGVVAELALLGNP